MEEEKDLEETVEPLIAPPRSSTSENRLWWTSGKKAVAGLLLIQMLERIAYYVILGNIFTFSGLYLNYKTSVATALPVVFTGFVYVLSPLFGWIADRRAGYFLTLVVALCTEMIGSVPIWYTGFETFADNITQQNMTQLEDRNIRLQGLYAGGLVVVILGASAFRATMIPFMLEQLGDGTENRKAISGFCSWSYAAVNIGASIGYGVGGYLQTLPGEPGHVHGLGLCQARHFTGFGWAYLLAPCSLFLAVVCLLLQRRRFKNVAVQGRLMYTPNLKLILMKSCGCIKKSQGPLYYDRSRLPQIEPTDGSEQDKLIRTEHEDRLAVLIPILSTLLIFHMIYIQTVTTFVQQGTHMDLALHLAEHESRRDDHTDNSSQPFCSSDFPKLVLPPSSVNIFNTITVLLVIPLVSYVIRPLYAHCRGKEMTMLTRIRWGIVFSIVACICALIVEVERLHCGSCDPLHYVYLRHGPVLYLIVYSPLSFISQIPQYAFVGVAEVLGNIASIEFVISRSPRELRCTAYGVFNFVLGLGDFVGEILVVIAQASGCYFSSMQEVEKQLSEVDLLKYQEEEQSSRAYVYFVLLTGLALVNLCVYIRVEFRHKDVQRKQRYRVQSILTEVAAARSLGSPDFSE